MCEYEVQFTIELLYFLKSVREGEMTTSYLGEKFPQFGRESSSKQFWNDSGTFQKMLILGSFCSFKGLGS